MQPKIPSSNSKTQMGEEEALAGSASQQESTEYIQSFLPNTTVSECEQLATALGNLPLALSHAVAYIIRTGDTIAQYLRSYQESGLQILAKQPQTTKTTATEVKSDEEEDGNFSYNQTILTTWQLSLAQIQQRSVKAEQCLMFCGYLYAEGITEEMLQKSLGVTLNDLNDLIIVLKNYSMIASAENGFKIHRPVQDVIRWKDQHADTDKTVDVWAERLKPLANTLFKLYPFQKQTTDYARAKQLQPHLEAVAEYLTPFVNPIIGKEDTAAIAQANLYAALGDLFSTVLGNPKKSMGYFEKSLEIRLATLGKAHPSMAVSYNNLGSAYSALGETKKAIGYYEQSLEIWLATLGRAHKYVAVSYNNLGLAYSALGETEKAIESYEESLKIRSATFGDAHPDVAVCYKNLGNAYNDSNDAKTAMDCFEKARNIFVTTFDDTHPRVAQTYNGMGNAHRILGNLQEAFSYHEKALTIRLSKYPEKHPEVAESYHDLGKDYLALKDRENALFNLEKAFSIYLEINPEHPKIAKVKTDLEAAQQLKPIVSQATHSSTMFGASALQASCKNNAEKDEKKADVLNVVNADTQLQQQEEQQLRITAKTSGCCVML